MAADEEAAVCNCCLAFRVLTILLAGVDLEMVAVGRGICCRWDRSVGFRAWRRWPNVPIRLLLFVGMVSVIAGISFLQIVQYIFRIVDY